MVENEKLSVDDEGKMKRTVTVEERSIFYELERKPVKNLNLRIRRDGSVYVSAHRRVPVSEIDAFVIRKGAYILQAIEQFTRLRQEESLPIPYTPQQCRAVLEEILKEQYPLRAAYGVPMPTLRIRQMKSCWGSCLYRKGIVTLNNRLMLKSRRCMEYVVLHELCHFVHPNHSREFYGLLGMLMPDWKERREELKG